MFMFLAPQNVHGPFQIPNRFLEYYEKKYFPDSKYKPGDNYRRYGYAMVLALDEAIGKLKDMLVKKGMWENTLFLFMSDNGGKVHEAPNFPLRGGKGGVMEGGVRVVSFISGGAVPNAMRGRWLDGPMHTCDWFSTFSTLAGVPGANEPGFMDPKSANSWSIPDRVKKVDSLNMWPYLSGQVPQSPRKVIHLQYDPDKFKKGAIIVGRWKFLMGGTGGFVPEPTSPDQNIEETITHYQCPSKEGCLFDLVTDETETYELHESPSHAKVLKQLQDLYAELGDTYFQAHFVDGYDKPDAFEAADGEYDGHWGPWQNDLPAGAMTDRKINGQEDETKDNVPDAKACEQLCGQGCKGWQFKPSPGPVKPEREGKNTCVTFKQIWFKEASIHEEVGYISGIKNSDHITVAGSLTQPWKNMNDLAADISQDDPSIDSGVFETCLALGQGSKEAQRLQKTMR